MRDEPTKRTLRPVNSRLENGAERIERSARSSWRFRTPSVDRASRRMVEGASPNRTGPSLLAVSAVCAPTAVHSRSRASTTSFPFPRADGMISPTLFQRAVNATARNERMSPRRGWQRPSEMKDWSTFVQSCSSDTVELLRCTMKQRAA
jgi:hypothetical protein